MTEKSTLRDYKRSRAVLIGTSDYVHLPGVPAAANSLERMVSLLSSDLCGWPPEKISVSKMFVRHAHPRHSSLGSVLAQDFVAAASLLSSAFFSTKLKNK